MKSSITNSDSNTAIALETLSFEAEELTITSNSGIATSGGGIYGNNIVMVSIKSSTFTDLKAENGGAIYFA